MFGFPPILDGNAGIKFTRDADSGFPKPGIREIFYSVRDGNWNDITIWQTASGRVGLTPGANDDVYVRHVVNLPSIGGTVSVNNLFISNRFSFTFQNLQVVNIQCTGTLVMNSSANLFISGNNNRIDNLITVAGLGTSTICYNGRGDQTILPLAYKNLTLGQQGVTSGVKRMVSDLVIDGALNTIGTTSGSLIAIFDASGVYSTILDVGCYNLTVNANTIIGNWSYIRKYNSEGNLLFLGNLGFSGGLPDFVGNISVEMRGGLSVNTFNGYYDCGNGIWRFTTANQTWTHSFATFAYTNKFEIADGITVTTAYGGGTGICTLNDTINGLGATSRLVQGANTILNFATAASVPSMTTGIVNFTTNANTIQYNGNYSATIPSYFTNFHSLTIGGTGTKTTGANVTANGNVSIGSNANLTLGGNLSITGNLTLTGIVGTQNSCFLECGNFNLSVTGTTTGSGGCSLTKTGAGSLLFVGAFSFVNLFSRLLFTGNPTVEFRNGFAFAGGNGLASDCGTGLWSFTTVSQTLNLSSAGTFTLNNVQIVGNITVTYSNPTGACLLTIGNSINGTTAGSTFVHAVGVAGSNNGLRIISSSIVIMSTGVFDLTTNNNLIIYDSTTPITLAYSTYRNLAVLGTGVKTLGSNTTVQGQLEVGRFTVASTLQCSTFNLTVNDATTMGTGASFLKSGAGSLTFIGVLNLNFFGFVFDLSGGNPTVELRGGLTYNTNANTFNSGTGQWTFSTASQAIASTAANLAITFNCPILISGANTLSINNNAGTFTVTMLGLLNGNNAASTLRMGTNSPTLNYQNTTQPMATGVLDTSTNLNTFIYGAGNQQVKGNPAVGLFQQYRNLTLNGGGNKTLQGNINVQNTYTVTAPAALVLNGFIKTP